MAKGTAKLTVLEVSISSVFTAVAYVESINGLAINTDQLEDSDLLSTAKEFLSGLPDGGEVVLDGFYDQGNATHKYLRNSALAASATPESFKIKWNGSATDQDAFSANVQRFSTTGRKNDLKRFSCTLKVTGMPTISS